LQEFSVRVLLVGEILPFVLGEGGVKQDVPSAVIGKDVNIAREPNGPFFPELGKSSRPSLFLDQTCRLVHKGSNAPGLLG